MNYPEIKATIGELTRYADRECKRRHRRGDYVKSTVIPRATRAEITKAERIADPDKTRKQWKQWVPLSYLVSEQSMLLIKSLRYASRTYIKHQKNEDKLPSLVQVGPKRFVVWDGNHRITIGLLIDPALHVRCFVIRSLTRKKSLRPRRKYG